MYKIVNTIIQIYNVLFKSCKIIFILLMFFLFFCFFLFETKYKNRYFQNLMLLRSNFKEILYFNKNKKLNFYNFLNNKKMFEMFFVKENKQNQYIISSGDNFSKILFKKGLKIKDISMIINKNVFLNNLKVGQKLIFKKDRYGELDILNLVISKNKQFVYFRKKNNWIVFKKREKKKEEIWVDKLIQGTVKDNFFKSAICYGLRENEILEVFRALKWKINLKNLKFGDKFIILLSREQTDKFNKKSKLLGIHLLTNKKNYYAFRAKNGYYYDTKAHCLEKFLLRYPTLKTFKVSSHFNFCRVNPITGKKMPHRGVDFSMPIGTPVLSVADGRIITAKYNDLAGNFIVIHHNNKKYITRYMHLRKILVKIGQKVKRGELIAFSGKTGKVTGPHLHYELWFNKKALNPLTTNLYYSDQLEGKDKKKYLSLLKSDKLKIVLNN